MFQNRISLTLQACVTALMTFVAGLPRWECVCVACEPVAETTAVECGCPCCEGVPPESRCCSTTPKSQPHMPGARSIEKPNGDRVEAPPCQRNLVIDDQQAVEQQRTDIGVLGFELAALPIAPESTMATAMPLRLCDALLLPPPVDRITLLQHLLI
jgi:hypothetical protein